MQTTSVKKLDNSHSEWINSLGFYKDELKIFKERLTEVADKNTAKETMQMVEHFYNQFLVQGESIDTLRHDINQHTGRVADEAKQHAGHIGGAELAAHSSLRERVEKQAVIFKGLKEEFMKFLSKVM